MTGKDLIVYILQNNLEDELIFQNNRFIGFASEEELASKFSVGVATIKWWHSIGWLKGIKIGKSIFFPAGIEDPRKANNYPGTPIANEEV